VSALRLSLGAAASLAIAATLGAQRPPSAAGSYLFVWTGDSARKSNDFLAVIDADPRSRAYGSVVTTLEVPGAGMPHHTEHELAPSGHLLASDFALGRSWLFDVSDARRPRVLATFAGVGGLSHPHSYVRLPDGNVIATFQYAGDVGAIPMEMGPSSAPAPRTRRRTGGLVVMDERGRMVRSASAFAPRADSAIYPYSVLPLPAIDRAVSTGTDMDPSDPASGHWVQLWRLSDLRLLRTFPLPPGPRKTEQQLAGEARLLSDGHSIYVHTFSCGLYLLDARALDAAPARFVYGFPGKDCGVPLVAGRYWIQPVPAEHAVVALDVTDPSHPREVSRVKVDTAEHPHWIALDPTGRRIVLDSGGDGHRLYILGLDTATGALTLDARFRDPGSPRPGVLFDGRQWPQGRIARSVPHGAVFSR
jgi:hypothetical protein